MINILSVKEVSLLHKKSVRDESGLFLAEGKKIIEEVLASRLPLLQVFVTEKFTREQREFLTNLELNDRQVTVISDSNATRLSDTVTPQGIFGVVKKPVVTLADLEKCSAVACFEDIKDPGNLGTMLRTADWFGVTGILVSSQGVDPYNAKVLRATMGSLFHLKIFASQDMATDLSTLKDAGFAVIVTRPEAPSQLALQLKKAEKFCVVLGNESVGTSADVDALADYTYAIPKYGQAESLNVAVSFGIVMQQLSAQVLE